MYCHVCVLVCCVHDNGWHGNILKPCKHSVVVAVYYRLKFVVNDLLIKIFKQMQFVWKQCLYSSNYTGVKSCLLVHPSSVTGGSVHHGLEYLHSHIMSERVLKEWYGKLDHAKTDHHVIKVPDSGHVFTAQSSAWQLSKLDHDDSSGKNLSNGCSVDVCQKKKTTKKMSYNHHVWRNFMSPTSNYGLWSTILSAIFIYIMFRLATPLHMHLKVTIYFSKFCWNHRKKVKKTKNKTTTNMTY